MIINICETSVVIILFAVGGLYWTGATSGNAAAGTGLVRMIPPPSIEAIEPKTSN